MPRTQHQLARKKGSWRIWEKQEAHREGRKWELRKKKSIAETFREALNNGNHRPWNQGIIKLIYPWQLVISTAVYNDEFKSIGRHNVKCMRWKTILIFVCNSIDLKLHLFFFKKNWVTRIRHPCLFWKQSWHSKYSIGSS